MMRAPWNGPSRILVTGGGTGIGLATVAHLCSLNVSVIAVGRRRAALDEAERLGAEVCSWDINQEPARLLETIGPIDGLVHNAGICRRAPIGEWTDEDWSVMWRTNVLAPALLSQAFAAQCSGPGAIVAVSSTLAERPAPQSAGYGTTKAALVNLVKHLALELAVKGIRANAVLPGVIITAMTEGHPDRASLEALHPLGRMGETHEVAQAVVSCLESPWMTGSILSIDGGLLIRE